jgi:hypothetical protein
MKKIILLSFILTASGSFAQNDSIKTIRGSEQQSGESLQLNWQENENWTAANTQENDKASLIEFIHPDESLDNWTEMGSMTSIKNTKNVPVDVAMNLMYEQAQKKAPSAKLTFIEKDDKALYPWIIFKIEAPKFNADKHPESQVWYIVQGKEALYTNFRAIKKSKITKDYEEKCVAFFKTGKVVNK